MITFVQGKSGFDAGLDTLAVPFTGNVSANNLLVACVYLTPETLTVSSITDTLGNSWSPATTVVHLGGSCNTAQQIWYAVAASSGACTVSLHQAGSDSLSQYAMRLFEFSGTDAISPLDAGAQGSGAPIANVSISPSQGSSLIVAQGAMGGSGAAFTPAAGYTAGPTPINDWIYDNTEYKIGASAGAQSVGFSAPVHLISAAVFKPAASGGGAAPYSRGRVVNRGGIASAYSRGHLVN